MTASQRVLGRQALLESLSTPLVADRVTVLSGPRGSGRSAVLAEVGARVRSQGHLVLATPGNPESDQPMAVVAELLRTWKVPGTHRGTWTRGQALAAFLEAHGPSDAAAVLAEFRSLLDNLLGAGPVLLIVDDVDQFDAESKALLEQLIRHPPDGPFRLLLSEGADDPFAGALKAQITGICLLGLTTADAAVLVDRLPQPPTGSGRAQVLRQAAGNPLALVELARVAVQQAASRPAGEVNLVGDRPLPPTPRLVRAFAPGFDRLPEPTRRALQERAAEVIAGSESAWEASVWQPAVAAGLIDLSAGNVKFRHPVIRAIAYHADAPVQSYRTAADLYGTGQQPVSGFPAALPRHQGRRPDPPIPTEMGYLSWALAPGAALRSIRFFHEAHTAHEAGMLVKPEVGQARPGFALAVLTLYLTGDPRVRQRFLTLLRGMDPPEPFDRMLIAAARALADPVLYRKPTLDLLRILPVEGDVVPPQTKGEPGRAELLGLAAVAVNSTEHALTWLQAPDTSGRLRSRGHLAWVQLDIGNLGQARYLARSVLDELVVPPTRPVRAGALSVVAVVAGLREEPGAHELMRAAVAEVASVGTASLSSRLQRWRGVIAAGQGDYEQAWILLRELYDGDGEPRHHLFADAGLADLVAAGVAVGAETAQVARTLLVRARPRLSGLAGPRLQIIRHRAEGLLAMLPDEAETHLRVAGEPGEPGEWPIELAMAHWDHGRWLRRHGRPNDARAALGAAVSGFERSGLVSWSARARAELAAAGGGRLAGPGTPAEQHGSSTVGAARLTGSQRRVAELAATGLSDAQIADLLGTSVRTVTTHLSRVYAQLGINRRMQLTQALR